MSPRMLADGLTKHSVIIHMSDEQLYLELSRSDPRYGQRGNRVETPPTSEDWALYHQAVQGLKALEAYEGTEWGGPDYGTEVLEPTPRVTYEWLETRDEWIERCHQLRQAEKNG